MAKSATVTLSVAYSGDGIGSGNTYSTSQSNAAAPSGGPQLLALTSGNNTVTFPTGCAVGALVVPPSASTNAKWLVSSASGPTFNKQPAFVPYGSASFVIYATAAENVDVFFL